MKLKGHSLTSKCDEIMTLQEMIVISFKNSAQNLEIKGLTSVLPNQF